MIFLQFHQSYKSFGSIMHGFIARAKTIRVVFILQFCLFSFFTDMLWNLALSFSPRHSLFTSSHLVSLLVFLFHSHSIPHTLATADGSNRRQVLCLRVQPPVSGRRRTQEPRESAQAGHGHGARVAAARLGMVRGFWCVFCMLMGWRLCVIFLCRWCVFCILYVGGIWRCV